MTAIIDSATELIAVEGADCTNCNGATYDITAAIEDGTSELADSTSTVDYGVSTLEGRWANDKFCLQLGKCIDIEFLYLESQQGLDSNIDGIIGFARPKSEYWLTGEKTNILSSKFYLEGLESSGEETVFSTRFQKTNISWIDIGAPDANQGKLDETVVMDGKKDYFWSSSNEGVRFGTSKTKAFSYG